MNTQLQATQKTNADLNYETSKFALNVGIVAAALVGLWGATCLIAGLMNGGGGTVIKGFFTAITGV